MARRSTERRRRRRRQKAAPTDEQLLHDAAIREHERRLRQARRDAQEVAPRTPRTYPLTALGWLGAVTTVIALFLLFALGAEGFWSWLYVCLSTLFTAVLLTVGHQHKDARFGMPLKAGTNNGIATNLAVVLAVLQLAGGLVGIEREITTGGPSGGSSITIFQQKICPQGPRFEFPDEHS